MAARPLPEYQQENVRAFLCLWLASEETQESVGKKLAMSQEYVSQLKNCKKQIGAAVALKVASAAGIPLEQLLEGGILRGLAFPSISRAAPMRRDRSFTPTPSPGSVVRSATVKTMTLDCAPNRDRALEMLVSRGYDREFVDAEMACAAIESGLGVGEDRPVSWWLDTLRGRIQKFDVAR